VSDLSCGVKITTSLLVQQIEDWLADNCSKHWELRLEETFEDSAKRMIAVYFESKDELGTFKQALKSKQIH